MEKKNIEVNDFTRLVVEATNELRKCEMERSYRMILSALVADPNAAQPHNLLGVWYELNSDYELARKHYRAAYALNPTYKPASRNIERVCSMYFTNLSEVDYGDINDEGPRKETLLQRMRNAGAKA